MISRYNRQELLSFVGGVGQQKLAESRAVVVGLGALGAVAAEILARAGIGRLVIVDRDVVGLTDLQRQLLYDEHDVGKPKALAAYEKLRKINSEIKIIAAASDIDHVNIAELVGKPEVILDCTDNLETRFLINEYSLKNSLAWVHAAAIRETAQLMTFDFRKGAAGLPCFACIFGNAVSEDTCETVGVISSATSAVAALQAAEAMKLIVGKQINPLCKLLRLNVWQPSMCEINVKKNPRCISCGLSTTYGYLQGKKAKSAVAMCGRSYYQIKGNPADLKKLKSKLKNLGEKIVDLGECVSFRNITVFRDGRALIKAKSSEHARAAYSRFVGN